MSLRDNLGDLKVPLTWTAGVALVVAAVVAIALLMSDRRETLKAEAYGATRRASDKVLAPVGNALAAPERWTGAGIDTVRGYFFAVSENRRLKAELKDMRQWRDVAIALRDTNDRYRTILGLRTDPPIPMVSALLVTDSRGPFANTRLANAGSDKGIKAGNPVMSENGLVGRIIGVTDGVSRVLLLTDLASRTPVMMDRTNARAILTGDGGPNPRLDYLRGREPVKEGDRVLTSGDGGVIPRGLPVGTAVKGLDGRWRVVLASDRAAIDFVRILLFEDFTQVVNQKALSEMPVPPPTLGGQVVGIAPTVASPVPAPAKAAPAATPAADATPKPATSAPRAPAPATPPGAKPSASALRSAVPKPTTAKPAAPKVTAQRPTSGGAPSATAGRVSPPSATRPAARPEPDEPPH